MQSFRTSWIAGRHGGAVRLLAIALAAVVFAAPSVRAAVINYGNSGDIPPGITFTNVMESSGTDPVPLYGPPSYFTTGMDFDPPSFVASATDGAGDITDGQLNFGDVASAIRCGGNEAG